MYLVKKRSVSAFIVLFPYFSLCECRFPSFCGFVHVCFFHCRDEVVHGDVMGGRLDVGNHLDGEAEPDLEHVAERGSGKETVVVSLATADAHAVRVENDAWHNGQLKGCIISEGGSLGLIDVVGSLATGRLGTDSAEFHRFAASHYGKKEFFPFLPLADEIMSEGFIGQGMKKKHHLRFNKARVCFKFLEKSLRDAHALNGREGLDALSDKLSQQLLLMPGF